MPLIGAFVAFLVVVMGAFGLLVKAWLEKQTEEIKSAGTERNNITHEKLADLQTQAKVNAEAIHDLANGGNVTAMKQALAETGIVDRRHPHINPNNLTDQGNAQEIADLTVAPNSL